MTLVEGDTATCDANVMDAQSIAIVSFPRRRESRSECFRALNTAPNNVVLSGSSGCVLP